MMSRSLTDSEQPRFVLELLVIYKQAYLIARDILQEIGVPPSLFAIRWIINKRSLVDLG
jgi:hypothetical protein